MPLSTSTSTSTLSSRVLLFLLTCSSWIYPVQSQNLTDEVLDLVTDNLAIGATHSWELGTRCQALVNFNISSYSLFDTSSVPPSGNQTVSSLSSSSLLTFQTLLNITSTIINDRPTTSPPNDAQPLFANDTSAGDPASMGFAALLANWTGAIGADFEGGARQQLNWLYSDNVPKSSKGAISHRQSEVQLWSDSVSMVPPFLAYYGLLTNNKTLLVDAYTQIKLYRDVLRDGNKSTSGLWFHIALGNVSTQDYSHWSTGNAWVVFGMSRVLACLKQSQFSNALKGQIKDLGKWMDEIFDGMYKRVDSSSGLFRNYVDQDGEGSFLDGSSSALIAAAVYRNAVLRDQVHHIPDAERARKFLSMTSMVTGGSQKVPGSGSSSDLGSGSAPAPSSAPSSTATHPSSLQSGSSVSPASSGSSPSLSPSPSSTPSPQSFTHFPDGWLTPVVDPLDWTQQGTHSPEGQAFVLEMQSAYLAWVQKGSFGINAALPTRGSVVSLILVLCVTVGTVVGMDLI